MFRLSSQYRYLVFAIFFVLFSIAFGGIPQRAHAQPVVDSAIPEAMELLQRPDPETVIFLVFGTATDNPSNPGLADMLMLVAVNQRTASVSMLSIPRDLYVYIPGFDMHKINTAYYYGETEGVKGGGVGLLKETIRYNLGIEVDYYARVNFTGFLSIIDTLGGIDIAVDCTIRDWKLKSRELNKLVADNYEIYMLPTGMHHIDADTALWYVRSRKTSSDLDRGRRQQDVLRAIWRAIRQQDWLTNLPTIWDQVTQSVETDLPFDIALGFAPMAAQIEPDRLVNYRFKNGTHIKAMLSPEPEYASILVPQRDALREMLLDFMTPPTPNQIARSVLKVQLVNASGIEDLEYVALDRLAQEGFLPEVIVENTHYRNYTSIYDYTGASKGSPLPDFQRVLRVTDEGVTISPDANRQTDYKIYLGHQYLYWACTRDVIQPRLAIDENGNVVVDETPEGETAATTP
jgi:polyisoprenyl-teichoic acid--peptidoglycan teichoic acid transferase